MLESVEVVKKKGNSKFWGSFVWVGFKFETFQLNVGNANVPCKNGYLRIKIS